MDMTKNDILSIREWAPLTDLLNKIPTRSFCGGVFISDLSLTCVDVLSDFIALGTNSDIAFWYDRRKGTLQRLRCEARSQSITAIKVVSSVDYMVACGSENGLVSVFTIPKECPINEQCGESKMKSTERYCIRDLHNSAITSLEWSKNGMKLFSGDRKGCVVLTEIDFYMHLCKSSELLNETYEVVQLSYNHPKLLISTLFRTIITEKKASKWEVWQVGRRERKCLSMLGSAFAPAAYPTEANKIYSCRPGHRLWIADFEGNVEKTLFFKDSVQKPKISVPVLNPSNTRRRILSSDPLGFGKLHQYGPFLVTYNNDFMYVLDPEVPQVLATMSQFRSILSASICGHEIFILEGSRSLIRISTSPDTNVIKSDDNLAIIINNPILSTLNSFKIFNDASESVEIDDDKESVINAEECFELPPVEKLPIDLTILKIQYSTLCTNSKVETFNKISEQHFDDNILHKSLLKMTPKTKSEDSSANNYEKRNRLLDVNAEEGDIKTTSPCLSILNLFGKENIALPDLRSPETILKDIESKEKKLAEVLHIEEITKLDQKASLEEIKLLPDIHDITETEYIPTIENNNYKGTDTTINCCMPEEPAICDRTPILINVPNTWNLQKIEIIENAPDLNTTNDTDSDWEVL